MVTLLPITGGAGAFRLPFSVGIFDSLVHYVRQAQISVGGNIYTVKQQSSW